MTTIGSPLDWAHAQEAAIGAPSTPTTDQTLIDWWHAEGGAGPEFGVPNNIANYNPINITETTGPQGYGYDPGSGKYYAGASPTPGNTPPVASFSDWTTGIQATADRLKQPFASQILADLKSGAPESQTAAAVAASGWGTGNFAGAHASGTTPAQPGPAGPTSAAAGTAGLNLNPADGFGIPATIAQELAGFAHSIWTEVGPFLLKAMLVGTGLGILVVAAYKAASPAIKSSSQQAAPIAEAGAAA
jgi:hypothetical protein